MSRFRPVMPEDSTEINLSPMLDVVFILLIFFIIVATFVREDGLDIVLSSANDKPVDAEAVTIRIELEGVFDINGRIVSRGSVMPYVRTLLTLNPDAAFAVMAANGVPIRDTTVAVDAGRSAGFSTVTIVPWED